MKKPVFGLLFLFILTTALLLRLYRLDLRPMHHDEANQAMKFGRLLEKGEYRYDRVDHHGPTLYYLSLPLTRIISGPKFAAVDESGLRLVPVLFGVGIILLLLLLTDALSKSAVFFAAIFAAISPLLVFYSRFYIQETLLVFFTVGAISSGWRYYRRPHPGWAVLGGFFLGMMYATKETSLIIFAALAGALLLTRITLSSPHSRREPTRGLGVTEKRTAHKKFWESRTLFQKGFGRRRQSNFIADEKSLLPNSGSMLPHACWATGAFLLTAVLFYSSFFTNPAGPVDSILSFKTYFSKAGDAGFHEHPWYYYLKMLVYSKYGSGPAWSEGFVLILALIGSAAAFKPKHAARAPYKPLRGKNSSGREIRHPQFDEKPKWVGKFSPVFLRFLFFYTLLTTAIFSLIPYKTPWNMLPFYIGMVMLAGAGAAVMLHGCAAHPANKERLPEQKSVSLNKSFGSPEPFFKRVLAAGGKSLLVLLLSAGVFNLWQQSLRANFKYYADNRNPYVYAQTVNDFKRLVSRVEAIAALHPRHHDMLIKVITGPYETWPLPWYLRAFKRVGYWREPAPALPLAGVPLIVASVDKDEKIRANLPDSYQVEYYGLRPGVLLIVYIRADIWEAFLKSISLASGGEGGFFEKSPPSTPQKTFVNLENVRCTPATAT
ncbi:MAG: TIGR03663 family protein [Candidatus Aminicenantes bacterium]|nr:TIGR03663 family protein [Candidatus Aminicenantes bacterium]